MSRSKKKGTGGESELRKLLSALPGLPIVRTPASSNVDLARPGLGPPVKALATRPDRGQWLITLDLETFMDLMKELPNVPLQIEVKRYSRFAIHAIWERKFGHG